MLPIPTHIRERPPFIRTPNCLRDSGTLSGFNHAKKMIKTKTRIITIPVTSPIFAGVPGESGLSGVVVVSVESVVAVPVVVVVVGEVVVVVVVVVVVLVVSVIEVVVVEPVTISHLVIESPFTSVAVTVRLSPTLAGTLNV